VSAAADRNELIRRLDEAHRQLREQVGTMSDEQLRWKPDGEAWTGLQILAHIAEFQTYFIGEMEKVLRDPAIRWGRGLDHPRRLQGVSDVARLDRAEAMRAVDEARSTVVSVLQGCSDADLDREAEHNNPKFGRKSMRWLVEHFILEHLEGHTAQLRRNVAQQAGAAAR
jgi:uncharacterized damage-inducible protein DinB